MTTLYVKALVRISYDGGVPLGVLTFTVPNWINAISQSYVYIYGTQNPSSIPYPTFPDDAAAMNYYKASAAAALVITTNSQFGSTYFTDSDIEEVDSTVLAGLSIVQSMIPTALSQLTNDEGFLTSSPIDSVAGKTGIVVLSKNDVGLANIDNTTDANKPVSTATQTALDLKVNASVLAVVATSGSYGDLTGKPTLFSGSYIDLANKPTIPSNVPVIYNGTTLLTNPKIQLLSSSTNSSGAVVFQLTTDGTSTGTAIFTSVPAINIDINSSAAAYGYSYAFSNSNKTLTVTVTQPTSLLSLGLLPNVTVASGVTVNARAFGN